jgi:altronate hydrolase
MTIELTDLPGYGPLPLDEVALWLTPKDNVAIVTKALEPGTILIHKDDQRTPITVQRLIPVGHKIALQDFAAGASVFRYGQIIGFASKLISAGDHVHTHNVVVQPIDRDNTMVSVSEPVEIVPESQRRTFLGFKRETGQVGTRNYVAVIATVNCSAHVCREIAAYFTPQRLQSYPNVDGVIPIVHAAGCTDRVGSSNYIVLQRTLAGIARHPNVAGFVLVGLGCEVNQDSELVANYELENAHSKVLSIQGLGGVRKTVTAGIAAVEQLLETAANCQRSTQPISELVVALQCGGSDSWSGITANPLIGRVTDVLVRQGATAVLAETPEVYGAEHLLAQRAAYPQIAQKLIGKIQWWQDYTAKFDLEINNNPSTGNKVGGLTTIYEKSLGAVTKGGSTSLMGVYDYAEAITSRGLVLMDTPGYDPVAVTGQVAGGCNIILFSTGRGSVFGFAPAPSIKIATNTPMFEHMRDDMDFNAGSLLDGNPLDDAASDLLDLLEAVASGQPSKSEAQWIGACEFVPWTLGAII